MYKGERERERERLFLDEKEREREREGREERESQLLLTVTVQCRRDTVEYDQTDRLTPEPLSRDNKTIPVRTN